MKTIFHIDVNSAFLSWEAVHRLQDLNEELDLREIPSAIGGDVTTRHGIVLAKSTPAKKYHIKTAEPIANALKKCPDLVVVPPNMKLYKKYSKAFMDILRDYSPDVEQYSVDEAFVDMTGCQSLFGEPVESAYKIKDRIKNELGFTVNIGISDVKLLAKMASDFEKPDKVHTLYKSEIEDKMWCLPVSELFFCGKSAVKKLNMLGIHTIGDLAKSDRNVIHGHLKSHGDLLWQLANGEDVSEVDTSEKENKGYGNSTTISFDVTDEDTAKMFLMSLCETVSSRLRKDHKMAEVIAVTIKDSDFNSRSHQKVLSAPTNVTDELYHVCCQLFSELWDGSPIRLLGVRTTKIYDDTAARQLNMFSGANYEKLSKLDAAMDSIRNKYGSDAIKRAAFLNTKKE
ncbi:MAG: DNA polymerase IV [Coprococcus sp.]|nr:DNA polymerase IV [Coprococcus sp.]